MGISRLRNWSWLALVLVLALAAAGCSCTQTDAQLAGEVQNKINDTYPGQPITVSAHAGVVTLTGAVNSEAQRRAAANDAVQVEGVKVVVNDLQVTPAAASIPEAPAASPPRLGGPASKQASPLRRKPQQSGALSAPPNGPTPSAYREPATESAAARRAEPAPDARVTIPEGTLLTVRMIDGIDSEKNRMGDTFRATLESPIVVGDQVVAPEGTEVEGRITDLKSAGHFSGRSELALELIRLDMNNRSYPLETTAWTTQGNSRGARTAATIGGGSAVGAIIGAIAGGGKGAAIGAAAGAGAGTGVQAATKGKQVKVNPEAVLEFRLENPVTVVASPAREAERQRLERDE